MGFPGSSAEKESGCNAGDPGSIPGLERSSGERIGYPLQYFGLENSMDCIGVHKQSPQLRDFHFQVMLVVKNPPATADRHKKQGFDPWVEKIHWRRAQQPTPLFVPGESYGQKSLANPMDRRAWPGAVHRDAQSRT